MTSWLQVPITDLNRGAGARGKTWHGTPYTAFEASSMAHLRDIQVNLMYQSREPVTDGAGSCCCAPATLCPHRAGKLALLREASSRPTLTFLVGEETHSPRLPQARRKSQGRRIQETHKACCFHLLFPTPLILPCRAGAERAAGLHLNL